MKIFRIRGIERSEVLTSRSQANRHMLYPFGLKADSSVPIHLKRAPGTGSSRLTDVMYVGSPHPWALSQKCVDMMGDILARDGNLYDACIVGVKKPYFIFSPSRVVDCIDESRSQISRTVFVTYLMRASFKECELNDVDVFVAKGFETDAMFVTARFRELFERATLCGISFDDG